MPSQPRGPVLFDGGAHLLSFDDGPVINSVPAGQPVVKLPRLSPRARKKLAHARHRGAKVAQLDPTRTVTMQRAFNRLLTQQFGQLKGRIVKLLKDDDAFGMLGRMASPPSANANPQGCNQHTGPGCSTVRSTEATITHEKDGLRVARFSYGARDEWGDVPEYEVRIHKSEQGKWSVNFTRGVGLEGFTSQTKDVEGGGAVGVFRAVGSVVDKFIADRKPDNLSFGADNSEPSRVRLYDSISKLLGKRHGYEVDRKSEHGVTTYTLLKQDGEPVKNQALTPFEDEFDLAVNRDLRFDIQQAALRADPNPTDAQKESGNYRKGHVVIQGIPITIETARGVKRKAHHDKPVAAHYGYVKRTESEADGDHVDVFIGPDPDSDRVWVIDQFKAGKGSSFDEHKCMVGFRSEEAAVQAYRDSYPDGWDGIGGVTELTVDQFRRWLKDGDTSRPLKGQVVNSNPEGCNQHTGPDCGSRVSSSIIGRAKRLEEAKAARERRADTVIPDSVKLPDHLWVAMPGHVADAALKEGHEGKVKGVMGHQENRKDSVYLATVKGITDHYAGMYEGSKVLKVETAKLDRSKCFYDAFEPPAEPGHPPFGDDHPGYVAYRGKLPKEALVVNHADGPSSQEFHVAVVCNGKVGWAPVGPGSGVPLVEVPHVAQRRSWSCGAAATAAVLLWAGFEVDHDDVLGWLGGTADRPTTPEAIVKLLGQFGLTAELREGLTLDDLAETQWRGQPVMVSVQQSLPAAELTDNGEEPEGWRRGHWLVVIGRGMGHVFAVDSSLPEEVGTVTAGRVMMAEDAFLDAWHDVDADGKPWVRMGIIVTGPEEDADPDPDEVMVGNDNPAGCNQHTGPSCSTVDAEASRSARVAKIIRKVTALAHSTLFTKLTELSLKAIDTWLLEQAANAQHPGSVTAAKVALTVALKGGKAVSKRLTKNAEGNDDGEDLDLDQEELLRTALAELAAVLGLPAPDAAEVSRLLERVRQNDGDAVENSNPEGCNQHTGPGCSIHVGSTVAEVKAAQAGDGKMLQKVIDDNRGLVIKLAGRHAKRKDPHFDDLVQEGNLALMRAVMKYDESKGAKFSTYAWWWADAMIRREAKRRKRTEVRERSADADVDEGGKKRFEPVALTHKTGREHVEEIAKALRSLTDRERDILSRRFGLGGDEPQTQEEVAKHHGITKMRVSQIEAEITKRLKRELTDNAWAELTANVVNADFSWVPDPAKIEAFQRWLATQLDELVQGRTQEELWDTFILKGWLKGAGRAFDDGGWAVAWAAVDPDGVSDFFEGSKEQFLRSAFGTPVSREKVRLMAGRAFDDLEHVTEDMATKMSRILTDGLIQGLGPDEVARQLADQCDISRKRAEVVAQHSLLSVHNEGQLTALEAMGVEQVGVAVEWLATPDARVCPRCKGLEGVVLTIAEARGMLPLHVGCRCCWVPANVGEDRSGQLRSKRDVNRALAGAGEQFRVTGPRPRPMINVTTLPAEDWLEMDDQVPVTREVHDGLVELEWLLGLNAFCPTGPGGGVDPSCGKGGGPAAPKSAAEVRKGQKQFRSPSDSQAVKDQLEGRGGHELHSKLAGGGKQDTMLDAILKESGRDGKPAVVTKEQMDELAKQGWTMSVRGTSDPKFSEQYRSGDMWSGAGIYGNGTYVQKAGGLLAKASFGTLAPRDEAEAVKVVGAYGPSFSRIAIPPDAKIVSLSQVKAEIKAHREQLNKDRTSGKLNQKQYDEMWKITEDEGRFAALQNHDGIQATAGGFIIILNRSIVAVQDTDLTTNRLAEGVKNSNPRGCNQHTGPGCGGSANDIKLGNDETARLKLKLTGGQQRVFVEATQKDGEVNWLNPKSKLAVESTFDLDQASKSVYFNRTDALVSKKGYAREVADHMMRKFAASGYETMTAYVQFIDQDSQSMMRKLGGEPGKETDHGRYWHFNLKRLADEKGD